MVLQRTRKILKSISDDGMIVFRYESNNFSHSHSQVELVPKISLEDLPYVMPALRVQQRKLKFVGDINTLPSSNKFSGPLEYASKSLLYMENEAAGTEGYLRNLVSQENGTGQHWLESDSNCNTNSFFEFNCVHDRDMKEMLLDVELIATKSYNPNGVVSIAIYHDGCWYLIVNEGNDHPLLDSRFPDISTRGHGYHIQSYPRGLQHWRQLRKLSVWHACPIEENTPTTVTNDSYEVDGKSRSSADESADEVSIHSIETEPSVFNQKNIDPEQFAPEHRTELASLGHCISHYRRNEKVFTNSIDISDSNIGTNPSLEKVDVTLAYQEDTVDREDDIKKSLDCTRRKRVIGVKRSKRGVQEQLSSPPAMNEKSSLLENSQNLGAFHHLAPLKKSGTSAVKEKLGLLGKIQHNDIIAWDKNGQPVGY